MALKAKDCVVLQKSILIFYEEDEHTGLTEQEAREPSCFRLVRGQNKDIKLSSDLVTFHKNIPGTSIRTDTLNLSERDAPQLTVIKTGQTFDLTSGRKEPSEFREVVGGLADCLDSGISSLSHKIDLVRDSLGGLTSLGQAVNTLSFHSAAQGNGANGYSSANGSPKGSSVVSGEIQEVLRWRPRLSDPQGFLSALEQSFERRDVGGTPDYTWRPRSYVVITDLSGEITGAQASLYSRAKLAVDESAKLLEGLEPLNPAFDEENFDADIAIIQGRMSEITQELGRPAGPRVAKLDTIFTQLLGGEDKVTADDVGGRLGHLRDHFGFDIGHVNTIGEEQNATNFRIMVDHLIALRVNWLNNRAYFNGEKRFLGTQMVLLERLLTNVAASAEEVRGALDAVLLSLHEQRSLVVRFSDHPAMLVDDLLDWVHDFGAEDGPRLARDGGRAAIASELLSSAAQLATLVEQAADPTVNEPGEHVPDEYYYPIVQTAWSQLRRHLETLVAEAQRSAPDPAAYGAKGVARAAAGR